MSALARLLAAALAVLGVVPLFYLGFVGLVAIIYASGDGPESAPDATAIVGVFALLLSAGVAVFMGWLGRYAITGRAERLPGRTVALAAAAGMGLLLVAWVGFLVRL